MDFCLDTLVVLLETSTHKDSRSASSYSEHLNDIEDIEDFKEKEKEKSNDYNNNRSVFGESNLNLNRGSQIEPLNLQEIGHKKE
eukprot:CAMPEP_0116891486 /NCGR_PEP_ID=MMETSP0467-20121206/1889_1 /TAXON_ID=283647 /ORGANISM="Mesodinium pulex, Strain SPMC105" /LENGTH=83 /DNA_ID=CAMNT_0004560023 /DNA_START=1776 /DNA_END=2030 /DNA_ORIENTATION=+